MHGNRLPRLMKHYFPTGRRNHSIPLKRLLDTWDRNRSTSGPPPWHIWWWWWWWQRNQAYCISLSCVCFVGRTWQSMKKGTVRSFHRNWKNICLLMFQFQRRKLIWKVSLSPFLWVWGWGGGGKYFMWK